MKKSTFLLRSALCGLLASASLSTFAQTWSFNADEVKAYAKFFQQPSAIEGKCNAEVLGIDINRDGFSWDDMNTWLNAEGTIWRSYTSGYSETVFGVCVNMSSPFLGKTSGLTWTTTEDDNKWYPAIAAVANLKGTFELPNCLATVIHISGTQLDTVRIQMNNTVSDNYLHIRRNLKLRQIDLSGTVGRCRQLAGYTNALSDETAFLCNNCPTSNFLDWLLNLENNHYTFSTIPVHPATGATLTSGYKSQWDHDGGYPIGYANSEGDYEIEIGEDIDLSGEYDVKGKMSTYTWKNLDGDVITPPDATADGWFCFDKSNLGQSYRCEITNATYPQMTLKTVFVTVVEKYSTGLNAASQTPMVKVGPSPARDVLNILGSGVDHIAIHSITGANVMNVAHPAGSIDISALTPGLYTARLTGEGLNMTVKFIKQ